MGRSKPLLPLGDQPVILRCLETLQAAGIEEVLAVLGQGAAEIESLLSGQPLTLLRNPDPDGDMASSVRVGLQKLPPTATAVLVCLADHPLVTTGTIRALLKQHQQNPDDIVIPSYRGKKGHPSLFPRSIIEELFQVPTLRHLVRQDQSRVRLVEVSDPGVVLDMDTPEDYRKALDLWKKSRAGC